MTIESRMRELGMDLPEPPQAAAVYQPAVLSGDYVFVAGQTPKFGNKLLFKGKVGRHLTVDEGREAARICVMRSLSAIKAVIGDLERIDQIVQLTGYVNCTDKFEDHSLVIDGASELIEQLLGEKGRHARVAVGSNALPGQAAVEIQMTIKLK